MKERAPCFINKQNNSLLIKDFEKQSKVTPKKIFEKLDISNKNNQLKSGDYSILFPMPAVDDEQNFN